jgi:uncharacterized protein (TIGR03435 family)
MSSVALLSLIAFLAATPQPQPVTFEAASIKPSSTTVYEGGLRSKVEYTPIRLTMSNVDLSDCITWAYQVKEDQISGGSEISGDRYDIIATSASPVPVTDLRIMLQTLLASRFQLTLHRETQLLPVYELTVAKRGPKLPPPKSDDQLVSHHSTESLPRVDNGSFVFSDTSLPEFAQKLSLLRGVERPVLDRTGISGYYDITLKGAATAVRQDDGTLFGLLEDQLGLKLTATKQPVEVLVIAHAGKPAPN